MSEAGPEETMPHTSRRERIAIVGGGIAGLFCAWVLSKDGHEVELFESSDVLGGRIRSFRFNPELLNDLETEHYPRSVKDEAVLNTALLPGPKTGYSDVEYNKRAWDQLEFNAEFGPMRIERDVQRLLAFLLRYLKIEPPNAKAPQAAPKTALDLVRMQRFPAFSSPASLGDPVYDLEPEEDGKTPLELLQLGVCRAVVDLRFATAGDDSPVQDDDRRVAARHTEFNELHNELIKELGKAAATRRPAGPVFESWLRHRINEDDYWIIQRFGQAPVVYGSDKYIPLHTMGFWNLMAAYLSHNALTKVRDLGSFYHFIPENPNAAEWLTWWMRQFAISSDLEGVFGGMQSIVEKLLVKMGITVGDRSAEPLSAKGLTNGGKLTIFRKATVLALLNGTEQESKQIRLAVRHEAPSNSGHPKPGQGSFQRVILALPTVPAEKLIQRSAIEVWGDADKQADFDEHLHAALPLQLLKVFFIVRERWWEEGVRANLGATRYPTREVYFWKSRISGSRRGMVMLYTDRPAASFWANYVPNRTQEDIEELCTPKLPKSASKKAKRAAEARATLRARMKSRFIEYVWENEGVKLTPDDIIWCGIMDWGREPYGAASHAWRPNRSYWDTLTALADWPLNSGVGASHLHVCGEAYSDYHGFIEGALRSSVHVLTQIKQNAAQTKAQRLGSIIDMLHDGKSLKICMDTITKWVDHEKYCADPTYRMNGKKPAKPGAGDELTKDEEFVKDFLDWSEKLNPSATSKRRPPKR
jgi:hypothetical protein